MNDEIFERIQNFVEKERWKYNFPLTREIRLEEDLDITGDDSVEFITAFGKEFNVDISKFMLADYFNGEGIDILSPIVKLITGKSKPAKKILTLGHLEKSVVAGKLDETVIE